MKERIMEFLQSHYKKTGHPYVSVTALKLHLGVMPSNELNELFKENKITVHPGINSKLLKINQS